ncbi:hypothetical protein UFOVP695_28 [uncultured Caudovirales phage]|uniref:Uncharacterized protein n=1 Tax=uncultured Caudovirales phage TaxID=2100421 RepID=A0A6J5NME6_9CAUD|nr:hypothetical protein UFOVP695_28 [uncultured Caudovirales phage]
MKKPITYFKLDENDITLFTDLLNNISDIQLMITFKPIIDIFLKEENKIKKYDVFTCIKDVSNLFINSLERNNEEIIDGIIQVELPSSYLISHFGNILRYQGVFKILESYGYILPSLNNGCQYMTKGFSKDGIGRSRCFLLNYKAVMSDPHLAFRHLNKSKLQLNFDDSTNPLMSKTLEECDMDYSKAIIEQFTLHSGNKIRLVSRIKEIINFSDRRWIKVSENTGRVFSSMSSLPKECRKHITLHNKSFVEIDVKNSQPSLLLGLMKESNVNVDKNFIKDVKNATIYSSFILLQGSFYKYDKKNKKMSIYINILKDKAAVKKEFFNSIFFDWKPQSSLNKKFKELYPNVWQFLKEYHSGPVELAGVLQKVESDIMNSIDIKVPFYSIFDAIYLRTSINDNITKVKMEIRKKYFEYTGIKVGVEISK